MSRKYRSPVQTSNPGGMTSRNVEFGSLKALHDTLSWQMMLGTKSKVGGVKKQTMSGLLQSLQLLEINEDANGREDTEESILNTSLETPNTPIRQENYERQNSGQIPQELEPATDTRLIEKDYEREICFPKHLLLPNFIEIANSKLEDTITVGSRSIEPITLFDHIVKTQEIVYQIGAITETRRPSGQSSDIDSAEIFAPVTDMMLDKGTDNVDSQYNQILSNITKIKAKSRSAKTAQERYIAAASPAENNEPEAETAEDALRKIQEALQAHREEKQQVGIEGPQSEVMGQQNQSATPIYEMESEPHASSSVAVTSSPPATLDRQDPSDVELSELFRQEDFFIHMWLDMTQNMKQIESGGGDVRRRVKLPISKFLNQIAGSQKQVMQVARQLYEHISRIGSENNPQLNKYVYTHLADHFISCVLMEVTAKAETVWPYAIAMNMLYQKLPPDAMQALKARVFYGCPYAVPHFVTKKPQETNDEWFLRRRWKPGETETNYFKRMEAQLRIWLALLVMQGNREELWAWWAHLLVQKPQRVGATVLLTGFQVCAFDCNKAFGPQFFKLVKYCLLHFLPMLDRGRSQQDQLVKVLVQRVKLFLEEALSMRGFPEPEGRQLQMQETRDAT
eukprot:Platyproteum_vivax@DN4232_c0_g1_i3.p1